MTDNNPFSAHLKPISAGGRSFKYFDLPALSNEYDKLPFSIRVLLESAVRNCDNFQVKPQDVNNVLGWTTNQSVEGGVEVAFKPARVILQDLTGVPAVVDFAAMRDAVKDLGGDPNKINPICPSDLVIDHSVQVDFTRAPDALQKNQEIEFERNFERFTFLKWGAEAFQNMLIVPPGSGIVHQVNLEYLARVVFSDGEILYPDSVVGTDSHTTMINGLGVVGWGVGGIEAEAVMLGQAITMLLPQVVGYKLTGQLNQYVTSTDLVLTITKHLRQLGVVGKFVEFFGPGVAELSIADRATISNMCPEYGATVGFFAVDEGSLSYLRQTSNPHDRRVECVAYFLWMKQQRDNRKSFGFDKDQKAVTVQWPPRIHKVLTLKKLVSFPDKPNDKIDIIEKYLKAVRMLRDYKDASQDPIFSEVVTLDLSTVVSCVSGPKRPHDRVSVSDMKEDFSNCLVNQATHVTVECVAYFQ